jgi:hypothetical protein
MAGEAMGVARRVRRVVWGIEDPRIRAPYRILLPILLLTIVLTRVAVFFAGIVVPPGSPVVISVLATGVFEAAFVGVLLVVWARYLDRRPIGDYGLSASPGWVLDLAVAFGAVLVGHAVWYAVGSALGWTDVTLVVSAGDTPFVVGLVALFVALGVNVWVQETVFVALPIRNAAEGLAAWGMTPRRAVLAGWVLAVLLFTSVHDQPGLATWVNHLVGLGTYALLYAHTGELSFPVGAHFGVNFSLNALFVTGSEKAGLAVFEVTESLGGLAGGLSGGRLPQILVAYLLLLAWFRWRHGTVSIRTDIAEWTPR